MDNLPESETNIPAYNLRWSEKDIPEKPTEEEVESARKYKQQLFKHRQDLRDAKEYLRLEFRRLDKIQKKWMIKL